MAGVVRCLWEEKYAFDRIELLLWIGKEESRKKSLLSCLKAEKSREEEMRDQKRWRSAWLMQLRNLGVLQCRGLSRDVWLPGLRKFWVMTCPVNGKSELYKALEQDIVDGSNNKVVNTTYGLCPQCTNIHRGVCLTRSCLLRGLETLT